MCRCILLFRRGLGSRRNLDITMKRIELHLKRKFRRRGGIKPVPAVRIIECMHTHTRHEWNMNVVWRLISTSARKGWSVVTILFVRNNSPSRVYNAIILHCTTHQTHTWRHGAVVNSVKSMHHHAIRFPCDGSPVTVLVWPNYAIKFLLSAPPCKRYATRRSSIWSDWVLLFRRTEFKTRQRAASLQRWIFILTAHAVGWLKEVYYKLCRKRNVTRSVILFFVCLNLLPSNWLLQRGRKLDCSLKMKDIQRAKWV